MRRRCCCRSTARRCPDGPTDWLPADVLASHPPPEPAASATTATAAATSIGVRPVRDTARRSGAGAIVVVDDPGSGLQPSPRRAQVDDDVFHALVALVGVLDRALGDHALRAPTSSRRKTRPASGAAAPAPSGSRGACRACSCPETARAPSASRRARRRARRRRSGDRRGRRAPAPATCTRPCR